MFNVENSGGKYVSERQRVTSLTINSKVKV